MSKQLPASSSAYQRSMQQPWQLRQQHRQQQSRSGGNGCQRHRQLMSMSCQVQGLLLPLNSRARLLGLLQNTRQQWRTWRSKAGLQSRRRAYRQV